MNRYYLFLFLLFFRFIFATTPAQGAKLGYDVATKEEVRRGIWAAVKEISPSKIKDWAVDFYEKKKTKYLSGKEYVVAHEVLFK